MFFADLYLFSKKNIFELLPRAMPVSFELGSLFYREFSMADPVRRVP